MLLAATALVYRTDEIIQVVSLLSNFLEYSILPPPRSLSVRPSQNIQLRCLLTVVNNFYDKPEMEKHADGADASVLIFSLCCANFLDVNGQNS